jgi:hypothetical protein
MKDEAAIKKVKELLTIWKASCKAIDPQKDKVSLEPDESQLKADARHSSLPEIRNLGRVKLGRMCDELEPWIGDMMDKFQYKIVNHKEFNTKGFWKRISKNEHFLMTEGRWIIDYLLPQRPSPEYFTENDLIYSVAISTNLSEIDLASIKKPENLDVVSIELEKPTKSFWDSISEDAYKPKK